MIIHATLETPDARWGGIGTAVDLAARASMRTGEDVVVIGPGPADTATLAPSGYELLTAVAPRWAPGDVYRSSQRIELGQRISQSIARRLSTRMVGARLVVHSEELAALLPLSTDHGVSLRVAFTHGLAAEEHPGQRALSAQQQSFFAAADRICTPSEAQRHRAATLCPGIRFEAAPLPLRLLAEDASHLRRGPDRRAPMIVAAGRAVPQKGFDVLLDAVESTGLPGSGRLLLIVGHGDQEHETLIADRVRRSSAPVELRQWTDRRQLLEVMASATAVAVPSRFEALGLVAAEALAVGTPVVASDTGGLRELLDGVHGCTLVPCGANGPEPQALGAVLHDVLMQPATVVAPNALDRWTEARFLDGLLGPKS